MQLRDHTFLGMTQSLCPECLGLTPAKIIARDGRVYFRKHCPTHGVREDFVCSDVSQFDQMEFNVPGKIPARFGVEPDRGCPFDCGLCTEHEQHTCIGLVEVTTSCNLECPMCYAASGPGGKHLPLEEVQQAIDRLVEVEGRPEVLQLSGGEPTIHPQFDQILEYACSRPIDIVMINTNGLRIARDSKFIHQLARYKHRIQAYLQFDGFRESTSLNLRGESLLETKLRAIELLGEHGIATIPVMTLQGGVNDDELGDVVRFCLARPWITGLSLQPATYSGRFVLPEELERRVTFPDVIKKIAAQTSGLFQESDFLPLPCAPELPQPGVRVPDWQRRDPADAIYRRQKPCRPVGERNYVQPGQGPRFDRTVFGLGRLLRGRGLRARQRAARPPAGRSRCRSFHFRRRGETERSLTTPTRPKIFSAGHSLNRCHNPTCFASRLRRFWMRTTSMCGG